MPDLADLVLKVKADTTDAKRNLNDLGDSATKSGGFLKGAAGNILGFAAGGAVLGIVSGGFHLLKDQLSDFVRASSEGAGVTAQMNAVLRSTHGAAGETADSLESLALGLSHTTTFSKDTVESAQNMLLTFTNIGQNVFPQATKTVLDMSQALGQDTKSSAIQLGKALNDPITGVSALQRVGVTFTSSQKDLIKSFVDTGQTAKAQQVIMAELNKEFGGSAAAAGKTFPGQLAILRNSLDETKQKIGDAIIPVLIGLLSAFQPVIFAVGDLVPKAADFLTKAFDKVAGVFKEVWGAAQTLKVPFQDLLGVFTDFGLYVKVHVLDPLGALGASARNGGTEVRKIQGFITDLYTPMLNVATGLRQFVTGLEGGYNSGSKFYGIGAAIAKIVRDDLNGAISTAQSIFATLGQIWKQIQPSLTSLFNSFVQLVPTILSLWGAVSPLGLAFKTLFPAIAELIPPILAVVAQVVGALVPAFKVIAPLVVSIANQLIAILAPAFAQLAAIIKPLIPVIGNVLTAVIKAIVPILAAVGAEIQNEVLPALKQMIPVILPIIAQVAVWIQQLSQVLIPIIQLVGSILAVVLPYAIGVVVRSFQLVFSIVQFIWPTISAIISDVVNNIVAVVQFFSDLLHGNWSKLWGDILNILKNVVGGILGIVGALGGSILGLFKGMIGGVLGAIGNFIGGILGFFGGLFDKLVGHSIIPDLINSIVTWFAGLPGKALNAILSLLSGIVSFFGRVFSGLLGAIGTGISNAATTMGTLPGKLLSALASLPGQMLTLGGNLLKSMATGITNGIGGVLSSIGNLKDQAVSALQGVGNNIKNTVNNIPGLGGIASHLGFASGTESAPGGVAWVGEGGEPEVVVGPHLANLPRGAGVYPLSKLGGGGSAPVYVSVQPADVYLDGDKVTQSVLRRTPKQVWLATGQRG